MNGRAVPWSCVTVDLHDLDLPADIAVASEWLAAEGARATFFVPSAMLGEPRYATVLRSLPVLGHEVASHSHHHDWNEVKALVSGTGLEFLARSRALHEDFFQAAPESFRAPHWCTLAPATIAELARLGYRADSSATPQRLPFLSSQPTRRGWLFTERRPHLLAPGLLELPTSTLLVPASASIFLTLRRAAPLFVRALMVEARAAGDRAVVVQLHVEDLNPESQRVRGFGPPTWHDFLPRRQGGFGLKWRFHDLDPRRIAKVHQGLVRMLASFRRMPLAEIGREWCARHGAAEDAGPSPPGDPR